MLSVNWLELGLVVSLEDSVLKINDTTFSRSDHEVSFKLTCAVEKNKIKLRKDVECAKDHDRYVCVFKSHTSMTSVLEADIAILCTAPFIHTNKCDFLGILM